MNYIVYRIYYDNQIVYVGRTKQRLIDRMRMHFFGNPYMPKIDIFRTTKIDYALFNSESDQFVYEVYLINLYHPVLNKHDSGCGDLTIRLQEPKFYNWTNPIIEKWKEKYIEYLIDTASLDDINEDFYFY